MNTHLHKLSQKTKRIITLALIVVLVVSSVSAGLLITIGDRITSTEGNGINYVGNSGVTPTALDGLLAFTPNGITAPTTSGISMTGADGISFNGLDGGTVGHANGISFNGLDGLLAITGANGISFNGLDGQPISIPPGDLTILGANGGTATDVSNIIFTGADSIIITVYGIVTNSLGLDILGPEPPLPPGLQGLDASLAKALDRATDDSNINAAVVYHNAVTDADIATLRQIGVLLGQRYHVLPV